MAIGVHKFHVEGISSLLMNSPHEMGGSSAGKLDTKKIPSPEDEAEAKVYRSEDRALFLPSISFRSSLLRGCTGRRIGKVGASTRVAAGVFNVETETPLVDPKSGKPITTYRVHRTRCVVQRQGIIRARPEILLWAAEVVFEIDDDFVTADQVKELLSIAGRIAGVGDWRPEKKGPHGRFKVI